MYIRKFISRKSSIIKLSSGSVWLIPGAVIVAIIVLLFATSRPNPSSFDSKGFSAQVKYEQESVKANLKSKNAGITFALNAPKAQKTTENTTTTYTISNDTSISYEIKKDGGEKGLKETIILKSPDAPNEYSFDLYLEGVKNFLPSPEDNSWHFYNEEGKEAFYIPPGVMEDAKGAISKDVKISLEKNAENHTIKVTADKNWLTDSNRQYPVKIDPSVIVSGTIAETEAQFGDMQRKVVFDEGKWFAFYTDTGSGASGTDVWFKTSADGTTWSSAIEVDATDDDNLNPSVWLEAQSNLIYVAWIDDSADAVEFNTVDTTSYYDTILATSGLVSYWRLGETTGTTADDSQGSNDGTYTGGYTLGTTGALAGDANKATTFNGSSAYVTVDDDATLDLGDGPLTLEFWAKRETTAVTEVIIDKGTNAYGSNFRPDDDTLCLVQVGVGETKCTTTEITDTDWHHYVLTKDGSTRFVYLDGADDSDVNTNRTLSDTTSAFQIGREGTSLYFDGTIDEVAVYNTAVSSSEAANHYEAGTVTDFGTKCTSADQGSIDTSSFIVSIAVADDGTVYVAYSDTSTDTEAAIFSVSSCTFTDITSGSGLTAEDRPVLVTTGNTAHMIFQDGNLSHSTYNGSWATSNTTIASVTDNVYSVTTDGTTYLWVLTVSGTTATNLYKIESGTLTINDVDTDMTSQGFTNFHCVGGHNCKLVYLDNTDSDFTFVDCNDALCAYPNIQDIDTNVGVGGAGVIFCPTSDDCKLVFEDNTTNDLIFIDCSNDLCSSSNSTTLDTEVGDFGGAWIYCPTADDCKITYNDSSGNDQLTFADCNDSTCSSPTFTIFDTEVDDGGAGAGAKHDCPTADDCKIGYFDTTDRDITFVDCDDATCSTSTITDIDTDVNTDASRPGIDCPTADDCKLVYFDSTDDDVSFVDCNDATCSSPTITDIDTDVGAGGASSIVCPSADNCKVVYRDGTDVDLTFVDCNDATCSSPTITDIDTDPGTATGGSVFCPTSNDCKIWYFDDTDNDVTFVDCSNEACTSSYNIESITAPWTSETNLTSVGLSYMIGDDRLIASVIKDSTEQAYWKYTDASTISWSSETSFGFDTANGLGHISGPLTAPTSTEYEALLRQGTNLEFSDETGPINETFIQGGTRLQGGTNISSQ